VNRKDPERNDGPPDESKSSLPDAVPKHPDWGANLSERRRQNAVELVETRIREIQAILSKTIPESGVMTGSATCAEVRLAETDAAHRYLRVAFMARRDLIDEVRAALLGNQFKDAAPGSDLSIIRIAHANGRRPHYVVCEGSRDRLDGPDAPHPISADGRVLRQRRLAAAMRPPSFVMSRIREIPSARGVDTETLEVQIFDEDDDGSDGLHERAAYDSKPE
jgi:hypothetical protein